MNLAYTKGTINIVIIRISEFLLCSPYVKKTKKRRDIVFY